MMMESQSQILDDDINISKLKTLVRYTSVICLVGERACELEEEIKEIFRTRGVEKVGTIEDLVALDTYRSKIVVCEDFSLIQPGDALMCFSVAAFQKVIGPDNKTIVSNGRGRYASFALECSKIHLHGDAKTLQNSALILENNGCEVNVPCDADLVIFSGGLNSESDLNKWITLREQMKKDTTLLHVSVFKNSISDCNANLEKIRKLGQIGVFTNVVFFGDNLEQSVITSIKEESGKATSSLDDAFLVAHENVDEKIILRLYLQQRQWLIVKQEIILEAVLNGNLKCFQLNSMPLPQMPTFCGVHDIKCLHLFPDPALSDCEEEEFVKLSKELGFEIARSVDTCHGVIVPVVASRDDSESGISPDSLPHRTIFCLRDMKDNGAHAICSHFHFAHYVGDRLADLGSFNIVGIRGEAEVKNFIERVFEGVGLKLTGRCQRKGKDVFFVDNKTACEKGGALNTLKKSGVLLIKTELVWDLISSSDKISIDKYYVNLEDYSNKSSPQIKVTSIKTELENPTSAENSTDPSVIQPTPVLFPSVPHNRDAVNEAPRKKIKLDWDSADEMAWVSKTRDLFGSFVTQNLRFSPLQLDVGPVYAKQLFNFPMTDLAVSMGLTFRADNLKTNTGVVNDFSKILTQCSYSPIVGGVFYDYTEDLVEEWGQKLFGFLAKMFLDMGIRNIFCREIIDNERGKDLFIILGEEQIDLCCYRTLDNQTDSSVSSAAFTACKFWIPERIIDLLVAKRRLFFGITSPHIIICCGDECFCQKAPINMLGKLVSYTCHQPENVSKLARKGALAYLFRTGDLAGTFFYEMDEDGVQIEGNSTEDFAEKLLALLKKRNCDSIVGDGKVSCNDCFKHDGFINVSKIDGIQINCNKCGNECTTGILVTAQT